MVDDDDKDNTPTVLLTNDNFSNKVIPKAECPLNDLEENLKVRQCVEAKLQDLRAGRVLLHQSRIDKRTPKIVISGGDVWHEDDESWTLKHPVHLTPADPRLTFDELGLDDPITRLCLSRFSEDVATRSMGCLMAVAANIVEGPERDAAFKAAANAILEFAYLVDWAPEGLCLLPSNMCSTQELLAGKIGFHDLKIASIYEGFRLLDGHYSSNDEKAKILREIILIPIGYPRKNPIVIVNVSNGLSISDPYPLDLKEWFVLDLEWRDESSLLDVIDQTEEAIATGQIWKMQQRRGEEEGIQNDPSVRVILKQLINFQWSWQRKTEDTKLESDYVRNAAQYLNGMLNQSVCAKLGTAEHASQVETQAMTTTTNYLNWGRVVQNAVEEHVKWSLLLLDN